MKYIEQFGLDTANECLWQGETQIALAPKPFAVLRYLAEHPGRLITHDELLDALWPETYVQPQVLRTYVQELRKVLGDTIADSRYIRTVPKRGYCFVAHVREQHEAPRRVEVDAEELRPEEPRKPRVAGREGEQARLLELWQRAASGQRQVVFVTGEAGIGKTALGDAFRQGLQDRPGGALSRLAQGQCIEGLGPREEYYPVSEALGQLCSGADGEAVGRVLRRVAPGWLPSSLRRNEAEGEVQPARARSCGELCAALEELAAEIPLLLVLEDLHWADESTLRLLSALARRHAPARLMVLLTARTADPISEHSLAGLKQDLRMRRLCVEVALGPLSREAVRTIVSAELSQDKLPAGLGDFVHMHAEGNPLFCLLILEHLRAESLLVCEGEDARWRPRVPFQEMDAGVPEDLRAMIEMEVQRLRPEERRLLEAGSLLDVAFPAWAVAAAVQADAGETEKACDALARRLYFLERAGEDELPDGTRSAFYVFAHGLYRDALRGRQSATQRAVGHLRIAERLREIFVGREAQVAHEMAAHYEAAGATWRSVEVLRLAAANAQARQAYREAAELLERCLHMAARLSGDERDAAEAAIQLELKQVRVGRRAASCLTQATASKA